MVYFIIFSTFVCFELVLFERFLNKLDLQKKKIKVLFNKVLSPTTFLRLVGPSYVLETGPTYSSHRVSFPHTVELWILKKKTEKEKNTHVELI